jgi:hypothetical protein
VRANYGEIGMAQRGMAGRSMRWCGLSSSMGMAKVGQRRSGGSGRGRLGNGVRILVALTESCGPLSFQPLHLKGHFSVSIIFY